MGKRRFGVIQRQQETCCGKVVFHSRKAAKGEAARARARSGHEDIQPYPCPKASHFHIGHDKDYGKRPLADRDDSAITGEADSLSPTIAGANASLRQVGAIAGSLWSTNDKAEGKI